MISVIGNWGEDRNYYYADKKKHTATKEQYA